MLLLFLCFIVFSLPLAPVKEIKEDAQEKEVQVYIDRAYQSSYSDPVRAISFSNTAILKAELSGDRNLLCRALVALGQTITSSDKCKYRTFVH